MRLVLRHVIAKRLQIFPVQRPVVSRQIETELGLAFADQGVQFLG
ncbi:hypothetical protein [Pseudomonas sp. FP198]|nr:hypothetical protein [Pseudomonas sp. FP198]WLG96773.1 hypothetical protein PSH78_05110 [Pseudomonas sp. FP198]